MTIYIIESLGILNGPVELPVIPGLGLQLPSNAVQLADQLPAPAPGHLWAMVDGQPKQMIDHRGTVYRTDTGTEQPHTELGPLPEGLTAQPRPSADHSWNGSEWAHDAALQAANRVALTAALCDRIDTAADAARAAVVGDPTRTVEYERAAAEAKLFAEAGYPAENVPRAVASWAISGRTAQQAADDILREAAAYTEALYQIRDTRLKAKESVRTAMAAGDTQLAENITAETIAAIQVAVAGVGNAEA